MSWSGAGVSGSGDRTELELSWSGNFWVGAELERSGFRNFLSGAELERSWSGAPKKCVELERSWSEKWSELPISVK